MKGSFNEVLDLVEIMVNDSKYGEKLVKPISESFETCVAAYWSRQIYIIRINFFRAVMKAQGEATREVYQNDPRWRYGRCRDAFAPGRRTY